MLSYVLVSLAAGVVDAALNASLVGALLGLGFFLPTLALGVRRLHDVGRSGWWVLIGLVPLVGVVLLIVWWRQDGTVGENRFGGDPKRGGLDPAVFDAAPPPARMA